MYKLTLIAFAAVALSTACAEEVSNTPAEQTQAEAAPAKTADPKEAVAQKDAPKKTTLVAQVAADAQLPETAPTSTN